MYCPYCGAQTADTSKFCTECGASLENAQVSNPEPEIVYEAVPVNSQAAASSDGVIYNREKDGGLLLAAFILNILSTVSLAAFIIPLAWCIPMTVRSYNIYKGKKPNTVAFAVCDLIFLNLIGGILMLVADKDE